MTLTDAIYELGFLFLGGPPPPNAYPACGRESLANGVTCAAFLGCE